MLRYFASRILLPACVLLAASNLFAQSWQYIAPMNVARVWHRAEILPNGKILVMGGQNQDGALSSCELYDPAQNNWTTVASMNVPRTRFQSCLLSDGRVFVAGGLNDLGNATTNTCEIYDPQNDEWQYTASMSEAREEFGLCQIPGNKIALIGGLDGNRSIVISSADVFDVASETVTPIADQLQISCAVSAVYSPISNAIYVAGGNQGGYGSWKLQTTQKYSLDTHEWTYVDSMIDRQGAQFNTLIDPATAEIYLFTNDTGYYNLRLTTLVESMNPSTEIWNQRGTFTPRSDPRGVIVGDSAVFVGGVGASDVGITNCSWFNLSTNQSSEGSPLLEPVMDGYVIYDSIATGNICDRNLYILGGQTSPNQVLADCEVLSLGGIAATVSLPTVSHISQASCIAVDTSIPILITPGCIPASASLDSAWLTGSQSFAISDTRSTPRSLATVDSILVSYSGSGSSDTAELHVRYTLGGNAQDTSILLVGTVSPLATQPSQLHRESASAYYGAIDSLPLALDVSSNINIDSLWPFVTEMRGTYSWDSSIVHSYAYLPPTGWNLNSLANHGNSVDFDIANGGASVTSPLDLGTALFRPNSTQASTSWVMLSDFSLLLGNESIGLCIADNEDNHWVVKTLGALNAVAEVPLPEAISFYPNPAESELFIENPDDVSVSIILYDGIGRTVATVNVPTQSTVTLDIASLPAGSYLAVSHQGNRITTRSISIVR